MDTRIMQGVKAKKMSPDKVDYDQIAARYDQRYAAAKYSGVEAALRELIGGLGATRVLEVGCGTGHWLEVLAAEERQVYGLDLSRGMLGEAKKRAAKLQLIIGRAAQLPFESESFDCVYCVNALHHFAQPQVFIAEAVRRLKVGGALAVIGSSPHTRQHRWYLYDYFEGTRQMDLERFPAWGEVLDWMLENGCERASWQVVEQVQAKFMGREVLRNPFLRKHGCSQLALLSEEDYAVGMAKIEAAIVAAEAEGKQLEFRTDLSLGMLVGWR